MLFQQYDSYTLTDHHTWSVLYNRQLDSIKKFAYRQFLKGIDQLRFLPEAIPEFNAVNRRLKNITGWTIFAVPGLIDNQLFFERLYEKKFAATTWIRKPEQIDYLEEPDMFHDVFGHVPLLSDPAICQYLKGLADLASRYNYQEEVTEAIARLYWYTIEFGLVKENNILKIYGAGILSSIAETAHCLSGKPALKPFDPQKILHTPYIKDSFQEQYFILDNFEDLVNVIPFLTDYFKNYTSGGSKLYYQK
ncbi:MAG: phenylalanine 4-monooxygenase [Flavitalea sp.]